MTQDGKIVEDGVTKQTAHSRLHRWTGQTPTPFERIQ